jgi:DNA (cytosine-5)-methyltransferase 1
VGIVADVKPKFRVPSMPEIAALPHNGYSLVSTFSGTGGSSLGYRIAGFEGLMACEFVPLAAECYALNFPGVPVDGRDIREVTGDDIRRMAGRDEIDVLEGSPPCASFSAAGTRSFGWGQVRLYSDVEQRVDDLFFEFARILGELQPRVFTAENVAGLTKGISKGYFKMIFRALQATGYELAAKVCDAQWWGVPQSRVRVIFMGVRKDLGVKPRFPKPLPYRYSLREAMVDSGMRLAPTVLQCSDGGSDARAPESIEGVAIGREYDHMLEGSKSTRYYSLMRTDRDKPSPTVTASGGDRPTGTVVHPTERRKFTIAELKRICAFPDDFQLVGTYKEQWERLGRAVPPIMASAVALGVYDALCEADGRERPVTDASWHRRLIG